MTTTNTIQPPAPLDITKLHSPAEVLRHKAEQAAYYDAIRAEEQRQRMKEQAEKAYATRFLTPDEYYEESLEREAARQAREAERDAERKAERDAKDAYLASAPDIAEISERNEYSFLLRLQHWLSHGYTVFPDSVQAFTLGCYMVKLQKPVTTKKSK